jgi:2-oxoglutarate ferredoxin oxidoreductase subunit gamma
MNRPSLDKFQARLEDGGVQIINSSLVDAELAETKRVKSVFVPANDIADEIGNSRMANMVAIGAYLQATGVIPVQAAIDSLENVISAHYKKLIPMNAKAIEAGAAHVA